ncbi:hypothetical protein MKX03_030707, partial [Papaver bracteatum]
MKTRNGEEEHHHTSIRLAPSTTKMNHYPPNHNNHNNKYYPTHSTSSFKGCCCLFPLFTFLVIKVLAVKPQYELQQVGVQYVGIATTTSGGAISSNKIVPSASLSFNIKIIFTTVNKVGIQY